MVAVKTYYIYYFMGSTSSGSDLLKGLEDFQVNWLAFARELPLSQWGTDTN